jgi:hypothetical protein
MVVALRVVLVSCLCILMWVASSVAIEPPDEAECPNGYEFTGSDLRFGRPWCRGSPEDRSLIAGSSRATPADIRMHLGGWIIGTGSFESDGAEDCGRVPEEIRAAANRALRERVGPAVFEQASCAGAQFIDSQRVLSAWHLKPGETGPNLPDFRVIFELRAESTEGDGGEKGAQQSAREPILLPIDVDLDGRGNLVRPLRVPLIADHSERARVISFARLLSVVERQHFPDQGLRIELIYLEPLDILAWNLSYETGGFAMHPCYKTLIVDAHDGHTIGVYSGDVIGCGSEAD